MRFYLPSTDENSPCGICSQDVSMEHKAFLCDFCNYWNHIECEGIDNENDALLNPDDPEIHCCKICKTEMLVSSNNLNNEIEIVNYPNQPLINNQEAQYCGVCLKKVGKRHKYVSCQLCKKRNHIKCDDIDNKTHASLNKSGESERYFCKLCKENIFVFQKLSDDQFIISIIKNIDIKEDLNLRIAPPTVLRKLFTDFSNNNEKDEPTPINCDYYDITSAIPSSNNCNLSMFHLNLASLGRHKDELVAVLSLLDFQFDVIAVTETKIKTGVDPIFDLSLPGYKHYLTPTDCDKGGVIVYVKENIDIKRRNDLEKNMYKTRELESVFLEIINEGKKNELFGCVYRHPSMTIDYFNDNIFNNFMDKFSKENKVSYLCGDFNIDLLKIETDDNINSFYNTLTSNLFVPHITLPTRITSHSKTLIDNIFSNDPEFTSGISGNFTFSISDHIAQFLIMPRTSLTKKTICIKGT